MYRSFASYNPFYRYGGLVFAIFLIVGGWRYGLYLWLDQAIMQEQAAVSRLQMQIVAQSQAEFQHTEFVSQLPILTNRCSLQERDCIGKNCYDQCSYLFGLAQKSGLKIVHYHSEKEKKDSFKESHFISLGLMGTLQQLDQFLKLLKDSCRLVQCCSITAHRVEQGHYTITAVIQSISPKK